MNYFLASLFSFFLVTTAMASSRLASHTIRAGDKRADGTYSTLGRFTITLDDPRGENILVNIDQMVSLFSSITASPTGKYTIYKLRASLRGISDSRLYDQDEKEIYLVLTAGVIQSRGELSISLGAGDLLPGEYEVTVENFAPNIIAIPPVRYSASRIKILTSTRF